MNNESISSFIELRHKTLTDLDFQETGLQLSNKLLDNYSGAESFVMVKQLISTLEYTLENLKAKAIADISGKKELILGAECNVSYRKKWEYDSDELVRLQNEESFVKHKIKNLKEILELAGENGVVNQSTGNIEYAKEISQQAILTTKFKKQ